jgi:hypothetical protein
MISARAQLRVRLIATILFVAWAGRTSAHDLYAAFVQHHVKIEVGAKHIDLTLDLTFFEEWSSRERQQMDADKDGRITRSEIEWYLMKHGPALASRVKMLVAGREVPLAELYEPEVELLGNNRAEPAHHRLRLFLFAPTPSTLRAGDSVVIEDRLWPQAQALITLDGAASDGGKSEAEKPDDPACAPAAAGAARVFTFRCVTPPEAADTSRGSPTKSAARPPSTPPQP